MDKELVEKIELASNALDAIVKIGGKNNQFRIVVDKIIKYKDFPSNKTIKIRSITSKLKVIYGVPQKDENLTDMGHRKIVATLRNAGLVIGDKDVSMNFSFLRNIQNALSNEEYKEIVEGYIEVERKSAKRTIRSAKRKPK